jgi:tRNA pseudouridine55 synthase
VHGVLLLDKPLGWSSNDALQKVKWLLRAEKAGHTGTLDPLATGVLPLCFGAATKFSQLQLEADKEYEATARLGTRTSTGDAEGDVIEVRPVQVTRRGCSAGGAAVYRAHPANAAHAQCFEERRQGLVRVCRAGIEVEREAREVTIYD